MKIISKFKDYYDYLQGVYGIDEKIVFDRRDGTNPLDKPMFIENGISILKFAICGKIYILHHYKGGFYMGEDIIRILDKDGAFSSKYYKYYNFNGEYFSTTYLEDHLKDTDINDKESCPILFSNPYKIVDRKHTWTKMVKLSDYNFQQFISPHDMYIMISNYLSREKPVTDNRTDVQKLVGKGFDKKTSFRNM